MNITPLSNPAITPGVRRAPATQLIPPHILAGYWHNWQAKDSGFIRLRDVSPHFDLIYVAFAISAGSNGKSPAGRMAFQPCEATSKSEIQFDISYLQKRRKKVLISIGGANGSVELASRKACENFVDSMVRIIREYGFDGIDVNLEGKLRIEDGDTDIRNPHSPSVIYLISAIRQLKDYFGPNFIISMSPETSTVQGGFSSYGQAQGAYLPVIHGLRDTLTYVHVQNYNSRSLPALDGNVYPLGTADSLTAMTEMLLQNFTVNGQADHIFPALCPEQVAIGLLASPCIGCGGFTPPDEVQKAVNYLMTGRPFGGAYQLRRPEGYPSLRGIMMWSINWDAANDLQFSLAARRYIDKFL
jgi:chitinase